MIVFPQLMSGASAQYPTVRRRRVRAIANRLLDGSVIKYADTGVSSNVWDLSFRDLTDSESDAVQSLFQAVEGRKGTFTFLDPTANLLAHSEELDRSSWTVSPMIAVAENIDDPLGGNRGIRVVNAAQAPQSIIQGFEAPAWFCYTFSLYARSASSAVSLSRSSSGAAHSRVFALGASWSRCVLSGALSSTDTLLRFGVELAAGATVDLFGLQVEAQPSVSAYKRTGERGGVHLSARFDDDTLRLLSDGPDQHRFDLRIVAKD
jgi:hypothetical protein